MAGDEIPPKIPNGNGATPKPLEPSPVAIAEARARQKLIGEELRQWYDAIAEEAVPEDLLDLLNKIDKPDKSAQGGRELFQ
jgi:hypothetical protein